MLRAESALRVARFSSAGETNNGVQIEKIALLLPVYARVGLSRRYNYHVFEWINRWRKPHNPTSKLGDRNSDAGSVRVEIAEFAPTMMQMLGLTAYLKLELYEAAARGISGASTLQSKEILASVAGETLQQHQQLTAEIRRRGEDPHIVMQAFTPVINEYVERIESSDWHQHVLSIYLVSGLFDGFFASLAGGIKDGFRSEVVKILRDNAGRDVLAALLASELEQDPLLGHRLSLWGRRLVGDTLLISQQVLTLSDHRKFVASEIDPIFTELTADHTRRMDDLGLTA